MFKSSVAQRKKLWPRWIESTKLPLASTLVRPNSSTVSGIVLTLSKVSFLDTGTSILIVSGTVQIVQNLGGHLKIYFVYQHYFPLIQ